MVKSNHGYNQYTKEEIIELAQKWFEKYGKLVQRDLLHKNGLPSSSQVKKHFGSLQNLLKEANIKSTTNPNLFNREQLSDDELLRNYKFFVENHLKTHMFLPTNDDLNKCESMKSVSLYISRFGSFDNINRLIGYQGEFHDGSAYKMFPERFKIQQEHDRRKREYAKSHNIELMEIWYWDFNNIEQILDKRFSLQQTA